MKLAEALQERADLNKRIEQLSTRLSVNATVQEGKTPAENPARQRKEMQHFTKRSHCPQGRSDNEDQGVQRAFE